MAATNLFQVDFDKSLNYIGGGTGEGAIEPRPPRF